MRPVEIDGVAYAGGREYNIPPAVRGHWFFAALLKDGAAKIMQEDAPAVKTKPTHVTTEPVAHKVETAAPAVEKKPVTTAAQPRKRAKAVVKK